MAQRKLTINLPKSPELLHELIIYLLKRGLISENEAHTLEPALETALIATGITIKK